MRLALVLVALWSAAAQPVPGDPWRWSGRIKLPVSPEKLAEMLASGEGAIRESAERMIQASSGAPREPARFRITYWQLDEDVHSEAILEAGVAGALAYIIIDRDGSGWWAVGRQIASTRGSRSGFRVANWPDANGARSLILEGARGWGTEYYSQGIEVFRLLGGRLVRIVESEIWESSMIWGGGPKPNLYSRSFVRVEPNRILVARRVIRSEQPYRDRPSDDAFRAAKLDRCYEHSPKGRREIETRECAHVSLLMPGAF